MEQVFAVTLKLPALVPVIEVPLTVSGPVPELVTVSVIGATEPARIRPALRAVGLMVMPGAPPVPVSVTICGEPLTLSAMLTDPV